MWQYYFKRTIKNKPRGEEYDETYSICNKYVAPPNPPGKYLLLFASIHSIFIWGGLGSQGSSCNDLFLSHIFRNVQVEEF